DRRRRDTRSRSFVARRWNRRGVTPSNRDAAMKPRLTTRVLCLALEIYEVGTAALWLLFGVGMVRALIKLARMVPMRPAAEPKSGPSQKTDGNTQASPRRAGSS